ncbi:hypothetical protein [Thiospirillum jenense]|uniref:Transmembrane protein n=1 Tax=Thiospirillum jenense TaxID=1653858 RepID=A0A839HAQ8_9GAMM|nr:hypothetical protein [Thiospirillum jenense]MBB1125871.1 hypothetical protein [Thiospirillum jenense]
MNSIQKPLHLTAALISLLFIISFWLSSVIAELFLSHNAIAMVKHTIVWSLVIFIPAIAITGGTGLAMAKENHHHLLIAKRQRMPLIAMTGVLLLIPAALFLNAKAQVNQFDLIFYSVQAIELLAGASNLLLISMNIRDGLSITRLDKAA